MDAARLGDRSLFPFLREVAYLNHAAVSPISAPVAAAIKQTTEGYGAGLAGAIDAFALRDRLRERLARFIGASPESTGFVQSTTTGISHVALSLPWRSGDRIVLFEGEFPANVTPWQRAAATFGAELDWVPVAPFHRDLDEGLAALDSVLSENTRIVAVSLVQFQSGLRMPVEAIAERCRRVGAEILVDGIQGMGVLPFDVVDADVDYLACGGHKWMMGVEGAGFIYVKPAAAGTLVPRTAGWTSHVDGWRFLFEGAGHLRYDRGFKQDASLFEGGSQSALGYAALDAAVGLLDEIGVERIYEHVQGYHDALEPEVVARGFASLRHRDSAARSGSLCFQPPSEVDVVALSTRLREQGISVAIPDGNLRFAPHWPNDLDQEVPQVLRVLDASLTQ